MIIILGDKRWRFPDKQIKSWDSKGNIEYQNIHFEFKRKRTKRGEQFIPDNPNNFKEDKGFFRNKNNKNLQDIAVKEIPIESTPIESTVKETPIESKKISICISAFNAAEYIEECLDSISRQTYFNSNKNYEILLGIDGCFETLNKVNLIKYKYNNLKIINISKNSGPYIMLNTLISHSKYDTICVIGADDIMLDDFLVTNINEYKESENFVVVKCVNFNHPNKNDRGCEYNPGGTIIFSRNIFLSLNGFEIWRCGADSDLVDRFKRNGLSIYNSNKVTILRRIHDHNLINSEKYGIKSKYRKNIQKLIRERKDTTIINEFITHNEIDLQEPLQKMQCNVSESVKRFKDKLFSKYNFTEYNDENKHAVFFGLYRTEDYEKLVNHKSNATVIWCGSDSMVIEKFSRYNLKAPNITHIAMSEFVSVDLKVLGITHTILPVTPTDINQITPKNRGTCIYMYSSRKNPSFYNEDMVVEIEERTKLKVIIAYRDSYNNSELMKVYKKCFIGLRLTPHDGLPNTVVEMGLMGRRCIYNGGLPHSIKWENIDDICESILQEYKNRKKNDINTISNDMFKFLDINIDFVKKVQLNIMTHKRPEFCLDLLKQIKEQDEYTDCDINVSVYHDRCDSNYSDVKKFCITNGWDYKKTDRNYGKWGFWELNNKMYKDLNNKRFDYYIQIPDDIIIVNDFFNRLTKLISKDVLCVNFFTLNSHEKIFEKIPEAEIMGTKIMETNWVDTCFISTYDVMKNIQIKIPKNSINKNNKYGSGVGASFRDVFNEKTGKKIIQTKFALCEHRGDISVMHPYHKKINDDKFREQGVMYPAKMNLIISDVEYVRNKFKDGLINLTVALPIFNMGRIVELALESLAKQKTTTTWELLVIEEKNNKDYGRDKLMSWSERLKESGCVRIEYIQLDEWIPLGLKWVKLAEIASDSKCFLLHAGDCYSHPDRLEETYQAFITQNCDYYDEQRGYFYSYKYDKALLFDAHDSCNHPCRLNMAWCTKLIKKLPENDKKKNIDVYIFNTLEKYGKIKKYRGQNTRTDGVDIHGYNNISDRDRFFEPLVVPDEYSHLFENTNIDMVTNLPILKRFKGLELNEDQIAKIKKS